MTVGMLATEGLPRLTVTGGYFSGGESVYNSGLF
jgi:hypothetical protein